MPRKSINLNLDFMLKDIFPNFSVKQFDDITLNITPKLNGEDYNVSSMTARFFIGCQNELFMQTSNITISSNSITVKVDKNMLSKDGRAYGEIELTDSNGTSTSSTFIFDIDEKIGEGATVPGTIEGFVAKYEKLLADFKEDSSNSILENNAKIDNLVLESNSKVSGIVEELQEDYDSLKRIVIDENASANLQNQINQANSQLDLKEKYLNTLALDAKAFGAKGDGVTIDTSYIKNAISLLGSKYNTILFSDGTFLVNDILLFENLKEVNIICKNAKIISTSSFTVSGTNDGLFTFNNCGKVNIEGLEINNFKTTNQQSFAIKLNTIEDVLIDRVIIKNLRANFNQYIGNLIQGEYVKNINIINSKFIGSPNWHGIGFVGTKCGERVYVDNCYFEDCSAYACDIHSSIESVLQNCLIKNCHGITKNQYGSLKVCNNTVLQDSNMITNVNGVDNQLIHAGKISGTDNADYLIIEDNYIKTFNSKCENTFHISNSNYVSIQNNYIDRDSDNGYKTLGINFTSYSKQIKDVAIKNNTLKLLKCNHYKGAIFYDESNLIVDKLIIEGNTFIVNSNTSTYAIRVVKDVNELKIDNNMVKIIYSGATSITNPFNCIWVDMPSDQSLKNNYNSICRNILTTVIDNASLVTNLSLMYQTASVAKGTICKDNQSKSSGTFRYGDYVTTGNQNIIPNAYLIKV